MLNVWNRYEIPMRAPPMPVEVAIGLAWYFVRMGKLGGASLILIGVDCFLHTSELLSLIIEDMTFNDAGLGVVRLARTKTGKRHAAFEAPRSMIQPAGYLFSASSIRTRQIQAGRITSSCQSLMCCTDCSSKVCVG